MNKVSEIIKDLGWLRIITILLFAYVIITNINPCSKNPFSAWKESNQVIVYDVTASGETARINYDATGMNVTDKNGNKILITSNMIKAKGFIKICQRK